MRKSKKKIAIYKMVDRKDYGGNCAYKKQNLGSFLVIFS